MDAVVTEPAMNFIISQSLSSLSGLFGGLSLSFFWRPPKLHQYGPFVAGVIIGSISVTTSFALVGLTARWLDANLNQLDIALALGYFIGLVSLGFITLLANFFQQCEGKNILDVLGEIKSVFYWFPKAKKTPPRRRTSSSKTKGQ